MLLDRVAQKLVGLFVIMVSTVGLFINLPTAPIWSGIEWLVE